jgi:hypothetical protein
MSEDHYPTKTMEALDMGFTENFSMMLSLIGTAIGIATVSVKAISLWVEDRKSRKIHISHGGLDLTIEGSMSEKEIEDKISIFSGVLKTLDPSSMEILVKDDA